MTQDTLRKITILIWLSLPLMASSQHLLDKKISYFSIRQTSPDQALRRLARQGNVEFSYKTDILRSSQSISITAENKTVSQLLHLLFNDDYEYTEQQNFIIVVKRSSYYIVSGQVSDKGSGIPMDSVQITSSSGVFSTWSDKDGSFRLKVPVCCPLDHIILIKDFYLDAFIQIKSTTDREIQVQMEATIIHELAPVITAAQPADKQKNINIHPLFNIRRRATGFEASGIFNINKSNAYNLQLAGAVNIVGKSLRGVQIAGVHNLVMDTTRGVQLATLVNKTEGPVKGVQIAAVNHARTLKGLQIGLINITDSSDGYSLGLLNFVLNSSGYHSLSLFASDLMNTNLAFRLGNHRLYTVFMMGTNLVPGEKLYAAGIGLGHDIILGTRMGISTEASLQAINAGSWDNTLFQVRSSLNLRILKGWSLFAGPSFNHYTNGQDQAIKGYKDMGTAGYKSSRDWIGWQAGITASDLLWSSGRRYTHKETGWSLQAGGGGGLSFDPYNAAKWISGDVRLQKGIVDNSIALMLTAGVNHRMARVTNFIDAAGLPGHFSSPAITDYLLKLGIKVYVIRDFYAAAELGTTLNNPHMVWSPSIGWLIGQRVDLSARVESVNAPMLLRLAYTLWKTP